MGKGNKSKQAMSELRIIAGTWRGRKLRFPHAEHLRPTTDRVRETLFNWLAPVIQGANCLDLFAGSGALGLEALSRGASSTHFVDTNPAACRALKDNCELLKTSAATIHQQAAYDFLSTSQQRFDIVFLDPPFSDQALDELIQRVADAQLLKDNAMIYLEQPAERPAPPTPEQWHLHREKRAGQVCYRLYQLDCSTAAD